MFFQLFSDVSIFFFLILFKHRNRNASCVLDEPHINHHYLELSCRDARSNLQCLGPVSSDLWNFFLFGTIVKTFQLTETYVPDSTKSPGFQDFIKTYSVDRGCLNGNFIMITLHTSIHWVLLLSTRLNHFFNSSVKLG